MAIDCRLDSANRFIWTTVRGAVTIQDLHQHLDAMHELVDAHFCELVDTREATPRFTPKELPLLAAHARLLFANRSMQPRAVVVDKNDLASIELASGFATLVASWLVVRVFDNVLTAATYIDEMVRSRE